MSRRSIAKAVKDYDRFTESKGNNTGAFWASDIQEVKELATNPMGGGRAIHSHCNGAESGLHDRVQDSPETPSTEDIRALEKEAGQPFSGLYATLPKYKTRPTEEERELYRLVYEYTEFSYRAYNIAQAFTILQAQETVESGRKELEIAWIASLVYEAGRIDGVRQERARRKRGKAY